MSDWDELLERLAEVPRENGTAALQQAAGWLQAVLERAGTETALVPFTATPLVLRLTGVFTLAGGLLYFRLMRSGRHGAALAAALLVPGLLLAQLEFQQPVFGWIGAQTQHHVTARIPAHQPVRRLAFAAHYDTKTDLLDHLERAPAELLAAPIILVMVLGALGAFGADRAARRHRPRRGLRAFGRVAAWAGALYGLLGFAAFSAGVFVPQRSPGALDNGAACALLLRLAEALARSPLEETDVELWLLSAEEVGVQGSWVYARERFGQPPELPTFVVNLEVLGASSELAVLPWERSILRAYAADPALVALLDGVHRRRFGAPLQRLSVGGATDARSFLARGIPAATLVSREPGQLFPRGLHSADDVRARIDTAALDASLAYLLDVARAADAGGLATPAAGAPPD